MNEIIIQRAEKHLYFLNMAAIPLWLVWIIFDYWFAPEEFYSFLFTRIGGSLLSILLVINHHKKWVGVFAAQFFMFAYYNGVLSFYISAIPYQALTPYFNGYMMIIIVMYFMLIVRIIDIIGFTLLTLLSFISVLIMGNHSFYEIMANGGFSFFTVIVLMILFATLRYKGLLKDVSLASKIEKAKETQELNKTLQIANKEKETLLKEIHHRVKNNLQLVSSMLNLQSSYIKDEKIAAILQESQQRIKTMSKIHESLYKSKNLSSINMAEYLKNLSQEIIELYSKNTKKKIVLYSDLEEIFFSINDAIPVGLLVNEIVTNSVKHAFPESEDGQINITLKKHDNTTFLTLSDNGIGWNKENTKKDSTSFGMDLIETLGEQIEAEVKIKNEKGLNYTFKILDSQI